jgi:hypothetical protein
MVLPIDIPMRKPLEATDLNAELKKIRKEIGIPYEDENEDDDLFQRHFRLRDRQCQAWHWEKCAKICRLIKDKIEIKNKFAQYGSRNIKASRSGQRRSNIRKIV